MTPDATAVLDRIPLHIGVVLVNCDCMYKMVTRVEQYIKKILVGWDELPVRKPLVIGHFKKSELFSLIFLS